MNVVELNSQSKINISLEPPSDVEAFFIFGIHKCGSSLMNKIFVDICRILDIPSLAIPEIAFAQGIPTEVWDSSSSLTSVVRDGYCHRGYRHFPIFFKDSMVFQQRKKILLVRDPRDAIVSSYFSFAKSHNLPKSGDLLQEMLQTRQNLQNTALENYAVDHAVNVKASFEQYNQHLSNDSKLKIYRYEDVIFDKENWIIDMLNFLNLNLRPVQIVRMAKQHNRIPKAESPTKHIRKVTPGDYKEKLSAQCIAKINHILQDVLARYSYEY